MQRWKILGLAILVVAAGSLVKVAKEAQPRNPLPTKARKASTRKVFPYSVIPGGAASPGELRTALLEDNVAARHYSDFRLDRTRVESLEQPRQVFVSYRVADRIFWTKKRLLLPKGETILTDGVVSARTRCGNRISEEPQSPVDAEHEPAPEVLDSWSAESAQTVWNLPPPEEPVNDVAEAAKSVNTAAPAGDLLARFGPELNSTMSGLGLRSGDFSGGGRSGGGGGIGSAGGLAAGGGTVGSAGNNVGNLTGANGSTGASSGISGRTPTNSGVASPGTTLAINTPASPGSAQSVSTVPLPAVPPAIVPIVLTSQVAFAGGFFIPQIPIEEQASNQIPVISPTTIPPSIPRVSRASSDFSVIGSPIIAGSPAEILAAEPGHNAEVPEPRTFAIAACGILLFALRFLKSGAWRGRTIR